MEVLVCVKKVPDTADTEVLLKPDGMGIEREDLAFGINEWDNYAVEEAIQIKENLGGKVTAVTIGSADDEDILRRCLAMGVDEAKRVDGDAFIGSDPYGIAKGLYHLARSGSYDLILTGVQAGDDGYSMVGPILAGYLKLPHATLVKSISLEDKKALVTRELEGGIEEVLRLDLPAVLTIQTGINEPRYVSIMGIRKVRGKEIPVLGPEDLGLDPLGVGEGANLIKMIGLAQPPAGGEAEMLTGSPADVAGRIIDIIREKGGVV